MISSQKKVQQLAKISEVSCKIATLIFGVLLVNVTMRLPVFLVNRCAIGIGIGILIRIFSTIILLAGIAAIICIPRRLAKWHWFYAGVFSYLFLSELGRIIPLLPAIQLSVWFLAGLAVIGILLAFAAEVFEMESRR